MFCLLRTGFPEPENLSRRTIKILSILSIHVNYRLRLAAVKGRLL